MRDFTTLNNDSFTQDFNQIDWQSIIANGNNSKYLTISRRRRCEYRRIVTETQSF